MTYSFSGQLTEFSASVGGVSRTLDSLASRDVFGFVAYDTDRLEDRSDGNFILRSGLSGEGFEFEANSARILGSQAIYLRDELDTATFFEFFEYDLFTRYVTKFMQVDLFGDGLIRSDAGFANALEVSRFVSGDGAFFSDVYYRESETVDSFGGVFEITRLWSDAVAVPEPASGLLLAAGLVPLLFATRRRAPLRQSIPPQRQ